MTRYSSGRPSLRTIKSFLVKRKENFRLVEDKHYMVTEKNLSLQLLYNGLTLKENLHLNFTTEALTKATCSKLYIKNGIVDSRYEYGIKPGQNMETFRQMRHILRMSNVLASCVCRRKSKDKLALVT